MLTLGSQGGGFGAEAGVGVVNWVVVPPDGAGRSPPGLGRWGMRRARRRRQKRLCRGRLERTSRGRLERSGGRPLGAGGQRCDRGALGRQWHPPGRSHVGGGVLFPRFLAPLRDDTDGIAVKSLTPDVSRLARVGPVRPVRVAQVGRVGVLLRDFGRNLLGHAHGVIRTRKPRNKTIWATVVCRRQRRNSDGRRADHCGERQHRTQLGGG